MSGAKSIRLLSFNTSSTNLSRWISWLLRLLRFRDLDEDWGSSVVVAGVVSSRRRVASAVRWMFLSLFSSPRSTSWSLPRVAPRSVGRVGCQKAELLLLMAVEGWSVDGDTAGLVAVERSPGVVVVAVVIDASLRFSICDSI